eukprot:GEMP01015146.1.p1 GENE.GEMP01015146.1~~GEMP01015146.1.p1  ORF type:complete len:603 (+),score=149.31 GEMP01015146.1:546-2354(+)
MTALRRYDRSQLANQLLMLCVCTGISILSGSYVFSTPVLSALSTPAIGASVTDDAAVTADSAAAQCVARVQDISIDEVLAKEAVSSSDGVVRAEACEGLTFSPLDVLESASPLDFTFHYFIWCVMVACTVLLWIIEWRKRCASDYRPFQRKKRKLLLLRNPRVNQFVSQMKDNWRNYWRPKRYQEIRQVWHHNLQREMSDFVHAASRSDYIAVDMEFPGFLYEASMYAGPRRGAIYKALRDNVNSLKPVQLGLTVGTSGKEETWQINFKFDKDRDLSQRASIVFLTNAGVEWARHRDEGVCLKHFLSIFEKFDTTRSRWVSFHGLYDFGFMLRMLTRAYLPDDIEDFLLLLDKIFPHRGDLKQLLACGSLSDLGAGSNVPRRGTAHQAGSDALLTLQVFHSLHMDDGAKADAFQNGHLYGFNDAPNVRANKSRRVLKWHKATNSRAPAAWAATTGYDTPPTAYCSRASSLSTVEEPEDASKQHETGSATSPLKTSSSEEGSIASGKPTEVLEAADTEPTSGHASTAERIERAQRAAEQAREEARIAEQKTTLLEHFVEDEWSRKTGSVTYEDLCGEQEYFFGFSSPQFCVPSYADVHHMQYA